jgi:acetyl-CoA carboxylase biotin carboxyl carrier protein
MEYKQIKELISTLEKSNLKKIHIKDKGGFELHLEKQEESHPAAVPASSIPHPHLFHHKEVEHPRFLSPAAPQHKAHEEAPAAKKEEKPGKYISSPMVGTFYSAPSPDDPPFIKVGDRIEENSIVCIIEAMKVMNEVKAGMSGTVIEILAENGHPVEFGTKIFRIE